MIRSDQAVQVAARVLFEGIAPERNGELKDLWQRYSPHFYILEDITREGPFIMDAGRYREVRFNHRAMRAFWVSAFAAWEGYRAIAEGVVASKIDLERFKSIVECVQDILRASDPEAVSLPENIPQPGSLPAAKQYPQMRAPAELAHFATGWALLHEVRHLIHQQEGTSAPPSASRAENHAEELSCDAFAIRFLLDKIGAYAARDGVDPALVRQKRKIGMYFAFFAMAVISKDHWDASDSHPAMQTRMTAATQLMGGNGTDVPDAVAYMSFAALAMLWPNAPKVLRT